MGYMSYYPQIIPLKSCHAYCAFLDLLVHMYYAREEGPDLPLSYHAQRA